MAKPRIDSTRGIRNSRRLIGYSFILAASVHEACDRIHYGDVIRCGAMNLRNYDALADTFAPFLQMPASIVNVPL